MNKVLFNYLRVVFILFVFGSVIFMAINKNDQENDSLNLLSDNKFSSSDTIQVNELNKMAHKYILTNVDQSHVFALKALLNARAIDFKKGMAESYFLIAKYHFFKNEDVKSINYCIKASEIRNDLNDNRGVAECNNLIGKIFLDQDMYDQAIDFYTKSLRIGEEVDDDLIVAESFTKLGNVYKDRFEYYQALNYYKRAKKIYIRLENKEGISSSHTDIGLIYIEQRNYYYAELAFKEALNLLNEQDPKRSVCYIELGNIAYAKKELNKALALYKESERIETLHQDNFDLAITQYSIAAAYQSLGKKLEVLDACEKSIRSSKLAGNKEITRDVYNLLSKFYARENRYDMAFKYQTAKDHIEDSIFNESKAREVGKLQAKFEFNKKLEDEKDLEKKLLIELEEQKSLHYLLIGIFLPILFSVMFIIAKVKVTTSYLRGMVFVTTLLAFEFILIILDPYIDQYSGGIPLSKLGINSALALMLAPLHQFLEKVLKKRLIDNSTKGLSI